MTLQGAACKPNEARRGEHRTQKQRGPAGLARSYKEQLRNSFVKVLQTLQGNDSFFQDSRNRSEGHKFTTELLQEHVSYCMCIIVSHGSATKGMETSQQSQL